MQNSRLACAINECCSEVPMLTKQFKLFCLLHQLQHCALCAVHYILQHCAASTALCFPLPSKTFEFIATGHCLPLHAQHFLALFSVFPYKDKSGLVNFNNLTSKVYALIQIEPVSKHVYHGMSDIICAKTQNT